MKRGGGIRLRPLGDSDLKRTCPLALPRLSAGSFSSAGLPSGACDPSSGAESPPS